MIPTSNSCRNNVSLTAYSPSNSSPWNRQKANHLFRRLGFGASPEMMTNALRQTPSELIDNLVEEAINIVPIPAPDWGYWVKEDFDQSSNNLFIYKRDLRVQMVGDFFTNNLRDRLTLFWSNHFVTEENVYRSPAYMFQYYNVLQFHAVGNFKDLTRDIGLTPAMLIYLNGFQNTKNRPNENYARELLELFTLGVDNGYQQRDIIEISRALTGWNKRPKAWGPITFNQNKFDNNPKTIFGETGNWGYEDVIDILFTKRPRKIAKFICSKLYSYFVSPEINQNIVSQLAQTLLNHNFEIAPVLKRLFKSKHFFNYKCRSVIIKSPADIQVTFFKELGFELPSNFQFNIKIQGGCAELGQKLFKPIDVAGWQGNKDWIDSSTLTLRWNRINWYLSRSWNYNQEQFRTIAKYIAGQNANDVNKVSRSIVNYFMSRPLKSPLEYQQALEIFKDQIPENYFEDGIWNLEWSTVPKQVFQLLKYIIRVPEFQLK